jgi:acetyltransferase-like isoleucine patch superfamily enzyme
LKIKFQGRQSRITSDQNFISISDYLIHAIFLTIYGVVKYIPSPLGDILRYICVFPFLKSCHVLRIYEGATLGNHLRIEHRTLIITSDHIFSDKSKPIFKQGLIGSKVVIEDDVWIGCNVTILKGVRVGKGAIIATGSLVLEDVPSRAVVGEIPARVVKRR